MQFRAIVGCGLLALTSAAHAATVSYTGTFSGPTDVTNQVINVAQFDSSLGTLVSATFELDATMTTSAFATHDGNFYFGWDKLTYDLSLTGAAPYNALAISASNAASRIVGTGTPDGSFTFAESQNIVGASPYNVAGPTLTASNTFNASPLAPFIGSGNLDFFLTTVNLDALFAAGLQTGGVPSPAPFGVSTSILGSVKVTYEYSPVPVPAAVWMLGSALGVLGVIRRKSKAA